jgi:hypothetical protein
MIFCCAFLVADLVAQDKPISKYSKKELLALVESQQAALVRNEIALKDNAKSMAILKAEQAANTEEIGELKAIKAQQEKNIQSLETQYAALKNKYELLLAEPPKNIEVLDLYSFGYQPYKYNERQYKQHLDDTRTDVISTRLKNVRDLVRLLQSQKIEEDVKKSLYLGFVLSYNGYLDVISQEKLTYYNEALEAKIKSGITQKTYKELDIISKENRWIQLLERF